MTIRSFGVVASVLAVVGCATFGCSSSNDAASVAASGNCPAVGAKACPMDTPETQDELNKCNASKSDAKCGASFVDVLKCAGNNVACDASGKSELSKFTANCRTQSEAYSKCLTPATAGDAGP